MFLVFSVCLLYALYCILTFLEDYIPNNQRKIIYWSTCILLIIMAGTREVGIDPDSANYEHLFLNPYSNRSLDAVEFSFLIIAQTFNSITNDVHALFFVYALLGVLLKFIAFRKYDENSWLLIVLMYISYYYELHETCQIRAGVLSGCMLMAIPYIADGQRMKALFWIIIGTFFHLSGIILLPLLFLGNKPLGKIWKILLALSVPVSYLFAGLNIGMDIFSEIPYIGNKLELYNQIEETGKGIVSSLELFSPFQLFTIAVFYYMLFWADVLTEKSRYFPLMLKIMAMALASYAFFSFIPVIGERMGSMYRTIIIVLFPTVVYTIWPKWGGVILFIMISFVFLNFSLRNMYGISFILNPA